jgi:hypothetical protein
MPGQVFFYDLLSSFAHRGNNFFLNSRKVDPLFRIILGKKPFPSISRRPIGICVTSLAETNPVQAVGKAYRVALVSWISLD